MGVHAQSLGLQYRIRKMICKVILLNGHGNKLGLRFHRHCTSNFTLVILRSIEDEGECANPWRVARGEAQNRA